MQYSCVTIETRNPTDMRMNTQWIRAGILVFLCNVFLSHQAIQDTKYSVIYRWRANDQRIEYPSEEAKSAAISRGEYIPRSVLLVSADVHVPSGRLFITATQFREGIPASLFEIIPGRGLLRPFPNWPSYENNRPSCRDIFSAFRVHIDRCGLMWVLDSGQSGMARNSTLYCQPKVLVYDLNNSDRLVAQYLIPEGVFNSRSRLSYIITESYKSDCSDSIAYIADRSDHALIVYDFPKQTSWRVEHALFWPYPNANEFLMTGVFTMALGPTSDRERLLYFHSLSGTKESWVPTSFLKNRTLASNPFASRGIFVESPGNRKNESTVEVMTEDGILIYALLMTNEIACWNSRTPYTIENQHTLILDDENLNWISGLKLRGNMLVITSSHFTEYRTGVADGSNVTSRVMLVEDVTRLLYNTPCAAGGSSQSSTSPSNYLGNAFAQPSRSSSNGGFGGGSNGAPSRRPSQSTIYGRNSFDLAQSRNSLNRRAGSFSSSWSYTKNQNYNLPPSTQWY